MLCGSRGNLSAWCGEVSYDFSQPLGGFLGYDLFADEGESVICKETEYASQPNMSDDNTEN